MKELVNVKIIDNTEAIQELLAEAKAAGLEAIGLAAEKNAKTEIKKKVYDVPQTPEQAKRYTRTGRLMNSISHAVKGDTVYVGTNVEYAEAVEVGTSKRMPRPYLVPAVTNYVEEYKQLMEQALKNA